MFGNLFAVVRKAAALRRLAAASLVLLAAALPAAAESLFIDGAGIVGSGTESQVESMLAKMGAEYNLDVRVVIVDDWSEYGRSIHDASERCYRDLGMKDDGFLFFMAMADRSYDLYAHGKRGESAFSHAMRDKMEESFMASFRSGDFDGGFRKAVSCAEDELVTWKRFGERDSSSRMIIIVVIVASIGISLFVIVSRYRSEKAKLCNVAFADKADRYADGDVEFTVNEDRFTHTTTRTITHSSGSGGRGSGGGGSHHSGHF